MSQTREMVASMIDPQIWFFGYSSLSISCNEDMQTKVTSYPLHIPNIQLWGRTSLITIDILMEMKGGSNEKNSAITGP